jgi:universal stress protein E
VQILAATDFSTRSQRALRRAGLLAQAGGAELTLVHVVDDDRPKNLVEIEMREAERILAEKISAMAELRGAQCRSLVVAGDPFDGILRSAGAIGADLIVMGAHRKLLLRDIFVGTTVERVMRTGPHPVLMVNNEVRQPYRNVVAAVDMSEPSANAIRAARSAGLIGDESLTLLHAFLPLGKHRMSVAGINHTAIDEYVASERQRAVDELVAFTAANQFDGPNAAAQGRRALRGDFAGRRGDEA